MAYISIRKQSMKKMWTKCLYLCLFLLFFFFLSGSGKAYAFTATNVTYDPNTYTMSADFSNWDGCPTFAWNDGGVHLYNVTTANFVGTAHSQDTSCSNTGCLPSVLPDNHNATWNDSDTYQIQVYSASCSGSTYYSQNFQKIQPTPTPTNTPTPTPTPTNTPTPTPTPVQGYNETGGSQFVTVCNQDGSSCELPSVAYGANAIDNRYWGGYYYSDPNLNSLPSNYQIPKIHFKTTISGTGTIVFSYVENSSYTLSPNWTNSVLIKNLGEYNLINATNQDIDSYVDLNDGLDENSGNLTANNNLSHYKGAVLVRVTGNVQITNMQSFFGYYVGTAPTSSNQNVVTQADTCDLVDIGCHLNYLFNPKYIDVSAWPIIREQLLAKAPFAYIITALSMDTSEIAGSSSSLSWDFSFTVPATNGQPEQRIPLVFNTNSQFATYVGYFKNLLTFAIYLWLIVYLIGLARRVI